MKIITLIENHSIARGIEAEHGLSLYLETYNNEGIVENRVLFDTGQSDAFMRNAVKLGVDLSKIDSVIISHGHYDHGGGLSAFLEFNKSAKVYLNREALKPRYDRKHEPVNFNLDEKLLERRVIFIDEITKIEDKLIIFPKADIVHAEDTGFIGNETFNDELFLCCISGESAVIISGCSHSGITNIIDSAKKTITIPLKAVIGGFHTINDKEERLDFIIDYFKKLPECMLGTCHCTGLDQYAYMKGKIPDQNLFYNYAGKTLII